MSDWLIVATQIRRYSYFQDVWCGRHFMVVCCSRRDKGLANTMRVIFVRRLTDDHDLLVVIELCVSKHYVTLHVCGRSQPGKLIVQRMKSSYELFNLYVFVLNIVQTCGKSGV